MHAAFLTGIRQLEIREAPEPDLASPRDVLLRVGAVGVCGSDVHYYTAGRIGSQAVTYPERVGHECAGTVVAVGGAVSGLKPGQRVAVALPGTGDDAVLLDLRTTPSVPAHLKLRDGESSRALPATSFCFHDRCS